MQQVLVAWLEREGWAVRLGRARDEADVVATRGGETLLVEVKGRTAAIGLDVDTAWGQILRRMTGGPGMAYALCGPPECARAFQRVPAAVRAALGVRILVVDDTGGVNDAAEPDATVG